MNDQVSNDKNLKIVFFGTPDFVKPVLETIQQQFNLVGVVTAPDKPVGRKQILTPSPVKSAVQNLALNIFTPEKFTDDVVKDIKELKPDLFVTAAFGKIIPPKVLNIPVYGALNIHPSLLPKYRGASPIQNAILNGNEVSGISIIKMDEEMDHGPVIYTEEIRLLDQDTFDKLSKDMFRRAAEVLPKVIADFIQEKIMEKEQNHAEATFTKIIRKEDGYFDIHNPPSPIQLDRMIRAFYPWPTTWTKWNNKIVKFYPGGLVQMEGKSPVTLKDFFNGYPNFPLKNR